MAYCKNCGNQIDDNAAFCDKCGTQVNAQTEQTAEQPVTVQVESVGGDADVQNNKSLAWLSYLGILLLIPLFARKTSEFCKYHVKQGAVLFCTNIAYMIVTRIILAIIGAVFPGTDYYLFIAPSAVYTVFSTIFSLAGIFFLVVSIIGIVNAVKGEKKELPLLGQIKILDGVMDKIYASLNK